MEKNHAQELKKVTDTEGVIFLISYVLYILSRREIIPIEILPFSGIPILYNFWLLSKHYKLMNLVIASGHPKKNQLQFRFYLNAIIDGLLIALILWEVLL